ncbi:MAG: hypothetical protein ACLRXA_24625 [Clostridium sp.]
MKIVIPADMLKLAEWMEHAYLWRSARKLPPVYAMLLKNPEAGLKISGSLPH